MSGATRSAPVSNRSVGVLRSVEVVSVSEMVVMGVLGRWRWPANSRRFAASSAPGRTLDPRIRENPGPCSPWPCHDEPVTRSDPRGLRGLAPLLLVSLVVVAVALGLARGVWLAN